MTNLNAPPTHDALRRELDQLRANGPWAHDVIDLARGQLHSDTLSAPLTASARSSRLAALSHLFDGSIFGEPTYRMSSRKPYLETPLAWLHASSPAFYLTEVEFIAWSQARNPGTERGFLQFHFEEPPPGKCLASFSVSASPWAGATAGITLRANGSSVTVPLTHAVNRSIDLVFEPAAGSPADVIMILEAGVQTLAFFFMTLGPAPLVFTRD